MKHPVVLALSCFAFGSVQADEGAVRLTFDPNLTVIITNNNTPDTKTAPLLTRKKHHSSIIFQGLAQSCQHLGTVVAADNKKEKQQGVLNILGSVFNTAAQLAAPSAPQQNTTTPEGQPAQPVQPAQPTSQPQPAQQAPALTKLTTAFLAELETMPVKADLTLFPLLVTFSSLQTAQEQELFVQDILSQPTDAKEYLNELFTALQAYLQIHISEILDYIKEDLFAMLDQGDSQASEIHFASNFPKISNHKCSCIMDVDEEMQA